MGENSETLVWLDFSLNCKYIDEGEYNKNIELNEKVCRLLMYMHNNPEKCGFVPL